MYDEKAETRWFSVIDIVQVLTQQPGYQVARNYWKVLKNRLRKEGSKLVTNCNQFKLTATDSKQRLTGQETRNKLTDYWREHNIMAAQRNNSSN